MKKNIIVLFVLVALVVGVGCFYGGIVYGKSSSKGFRPNIVGMGQRGDVANRAGMLSGGGGFISGEVISQDSQSITVKLKDTGTKIIFLSTSTQVIKTTEGSTSDIAIGSNLTITGKANTDGSITAQSIQIRPSVPVIGK